MRQHPSRMSERRLRGTLVASLLALILLLPSIQVTVAAPPASAGPDFDDLAIGDVVAQGHRQADGTCFVEYRLTTHLAPEEGLKEIRLEPDDDCTLRVVSKETLSRAEGMRRARAMHESDGLPGTETPGELQSEPPSQSFSLLPTASAGSMREIQAMAWTWSYGIPGSWDKLTWKKHYQTHRYDLSCTYARTVDDYGMAGVGWLMARNIWAYSHNGCSRVRSWGEADFAHGSGGWVHTLGAAVGGLPTGGVYYDNYWWGSVVNGVTHSNAVIYDNPV